MRPVLASTSRAALASYRSVMVSTTIKSAPAFAPASAISRNRSYARSKDSVPIGSNFSAVFDCFDSSVIGLAMDTNMKAPLCVQTLENTANAYPGIRGAIIHSDRGSQYTSQLYRDAVQKYGIQQSMNSAGGRCHDNARCESMWARMKSELLYDRYDTEKMTTDELRTIIWRYFISYWNNRRICSANGGLPPMVKRQQYYDSLKEAA